MGNGKDGCDNIDAWRYGRCDRDVYVYFKNKIGSTCGLWLFYRGWSNDAVPFGSRNRWYCYDWDSAGCVAGNGFEVPNKVIVMLAKYV